MVKHLEKIEQLIEPVVSDLGFTLLGAEEAGEQAGRVVRVYIDGPSGVNLDDCAQVSRQISAILDVEDAVIGQYKLEVSSPGIDRPLFSMAQTMDAVGQSVALKVAVAVEGRRQFKGLLQKIEADVLSIFVDDMNQVVEIDWNNINKIHICGKVQMNR